jgi:hypothetical protein
MCSDPGRLHSYGRAGRTAYQTRYRWEQEARQLHWHLRQAGLLPP